MAEDIENEEELEDEDLDEDLDDEDLDEEDLLEDDLDDDVIPEIDEDLEIDEVLVAEVPDALPEVVVEEPVAEVPAVEAEDDEVVDLEEELHPDDVEETLDAILAQRTATTAIDEDEDEVDDEDDGEIDEPGGDGPAKIAPRRPGEFLCTSCFLVQPKHMLADKKRMLCRDCV